MELLFERLETMNGACIDRFSAWFAYHLSNFQFRWNWEDWNAALSLDPLHPKPKFVRETLVRCMRLSYHQRIADLVHESFQPLLPEPPNPINLYEGDTEGIVDSELEAANELTKMVTEKSSIDEILEKIHAISSPMDDVGSEFSELQIKVFSNVLLNCASKSFTHLFAAIGK